MRNILKVVLDEAVSPLPSSLICLGPLPVMSLGTSRPVPLLWPSSGGGRSVEFVFELEGKASPCEKVERNISL